MSEAYKMAYYKFLSNETTTNAILAIKAYLKADAQLPKKLVPYAIHACDALLTREGNAVSSKTTQQLWEERITDVCVLTKKCNLKVKDAIAIIAKRENVAVSSLKKEYSQLGKKGRELLDLSDAINKLVLSKRY